MTNCFYYIDGLISNSLQKLFLKIKLFKNLKKKKKSSLHQRSALYKESKRANQSTPSEGTPSTLQERLHIGSVNGPAIRRHRAHKKKQDPTHAFNLWNILPLGS